MKTVTIIKRLLIILLAFLSLAVISCKKREINPENVRTGTERAITIINNTGNDISGYLINAGSDGPEIAKSTSDKNSFSIIINEKWINDPNIEVVLYDQFGNIYKNTVNVPLKGNTDIPIGREHKISQGFVRDKYNAFVEWINKNK